MNLNLISSDFIDLPHGKLSGEMNLEAGKSYGLVGANGIGKSSLLKWCKRNLDGDIAYLDQSRLQPLVNLFVSDIFRIAELELKVDSKRLKSLLEFFKMESLIDKKVHNLSGGENQVLQIILTFSLGRQWTFLDEPLLNLSELNRIKVIELIEKEKSEGKSFLIIEHQKELLEKVVDKTFEIQGENGEYHVN